MGAFRRFGWRSLAFSLHLVLPMTQWIFAVSKSNTFVAFGFFYVERLELCAGLGLCSSTVAVALAVD